MAVYWLGDYALYRGGQAFPKTRAKAASERLSCAPVLGWLSPSIVSGKVTCNHVFSEGFLGAVSSHSARRSELSSVLIAWGIVAAVPFKGALAKPLIEARSGGPCQRALCRARAIKLWCVKSGQANTPPVYPCTDQHGVAIDHASFLARANAANGKACGDFDPTFVRADGLKGGLGGEPPHAHQDEGNKGTSPPKRPAKQPFPPSLVTGRAGQGWAAKSEACWSAFWLAGWWEGHLHIKLA